MPQINWIQSLDLCMWIPKMNENFIHACSGNFYAKPSNGHPLPLRARKRGACAPPPTRRTMSWAEFLEAGPNLVQLPFRHFFNS